MLQQDPVNRIVGNMHPIHLFDLLLEMCGAERILVMSGQDESFSLVRDLSGLSSWRLWIRITPRLPVRCDNPVDPLPAHVMIVRKVTNRPPSLPLTNDTSDIPIGELAHTQI